MQYIDEEAIRELYEKAGSVALISNSARGAFALVQRRYKSEPVYGMIDLSRKINQRESIGGRIGSRASPTSWVFGEYKVFGWVLACLSKASNLEIAEFSAAEHRQLQVIFRAKTPYFLRYETKMFASHKHASSQFWDPKEIEALQNLLLNYPTAPNWKDISYQLFCISQGRFFRTLNQCREKWMNHLNPNVSKERWTIEQDRLLFELAEQYGCRWAKISKEMGSRRTEHMVKNRYNWYTRRIGRKKCPNDITRMIKNSSQIDLSESQSEGYSEFQLSSRERKELKQPLVCGELRNQNQIRAEQKQKRSRLPRVAKQTKQSKIKKSNKKGREEQFDRINEEEREEDISENQQPEKIKQLSRVKAAIVAKEECDQNQEIDSVSERMKGLVRVEQDLTPHFRVKEEWGEKGIKVEGEDKPEDEQDDEEERQPVKVEEHWQNYYPFLQLMMPHMHWN